MAFVPISYISCTNCCTISAVFDTVSGGLGENPPDCDSPDCSGGCSSHGDVVYADGHWIVRVNTEAGYPHFDVEEIPPVPCWWQPGTPGPNFTVETTPAIGDGFGTADLTLIYDLDPDADADLEYTLNYSPDAVWQDSLHFEDLAPGTYYIGIRDKNHLDCPSYSPSSVGVDIIHIPNLDGSGPGGPGAGVGVTISSTNVTANGAHDGTLQVLIQSGSGHYTVTLYWEGVPIVLDSGVIPVAVNRFGLYPDNYSVLVHDNVTGQDVNLSTVITEPPPVVPPDPATVGNSIFVPMMNSIQFVKEESVNDCSILQTLDNVLFCKQRFEGFWPSHYWQKVAKCDILTLQIQSNYLDQGLTIQLKNYKTGAVVKTYIALTKENNTGQIQSFDVTLTADDNPARSRVFFNVGSIPVPVAVNDSFEVFDNADGMNGTYLIVGIQNDELLGTQFLVITKAYSAGTPSSNAKAKFLVSLLDFNVQEVLINNLETVANGVYYFQITAASTQATITYVSEPIDLKPTHPGTNLIEYRNFDNAYDMTWTTGILCRVRIPSRLFQRVPGGSRTTTRNSDESLHKLQAKKRRGVKFELFRLPPYLLEKLSVIFDCDYFAINGVEYQTDEEIAEPRYTNFFALANSDIRVEQVGWFRKQNSDDLGNVDVEEGFIIANGGFIKR